MGTPKFYKVLHRGLPAIGREVKVYYYLTVSGREFYDVTYRVSNKSEYINVEMTAEEMNELVRRLVPVRHSVPLGDE